MIRFDLHFPANHDIQGTFSMTTLLTLCVLNSLVISQPTPPATTANDRTPQVVSITFRMRLIDQHAGALAGYSGSIIPSIDLSDGTKRVLPSLDVIDGIPPAELESKVLLHIPPSVSWGRLRTSSDKFDLRYGGGIHLSAINNHLDTLVPLDADSDGAFSLAIWNAEDGVQLTLQLDWIVAISRTLAPTKPSLPDANSTLLSGDTLEYTIDIEQLSSATLQFRGNLRLRSNMEGRNSASLPADMFLVNSPTYAAYQRKERFQPQPTDRVLDIVLAADGYFTLTYSGQDHSSYVANNLHVTVDILAHYWSRPITGSHTISIWNQKDRIQLRIPIRWTIARHRQGQNAPTKKLQAA